MREMVLLQLEAKFPALPPSVKERVMAMPADALARLMIDFVHAQALEELHLTD